MRVRRRRLAAALLFPCLPLLGACRSLRVVDLVAKDDSVLFLEGRASTRLGGRAEPSPDGGPVEESWPRAWIEFDGSFAGGEDDFTLPPGQAIVLGGVVFTGDLHSTFDLDRILINLRLASEPKRGFSAEAFAGLEYSSMDVTLRSGGTPGVSPSGSQQVTGIGPAFGVTLAWQPVDLLRVSAEGRASFGFSSDAESVETSSLEVGVSLFPSAGVGLFGGWRTVKYDADLDSAVSILGPTVSSLDLELSGPVLGLRVRF